MDAEDLLLRQFLGIRDEPHPSRSALHPRRAARGRHLGHLPRRSRRTSPPPSRRTSRCGWPGTRPTRAHGAARPPGSATGAASPRPGSSPASGWRCSAGGSGTTCPKLAARAHLLPEVDAAQHLRLRLLGPADHRAAHRRLREAPGAPAPFAPRRAAHRPATARTRAARPAPLASWDGVFQRLDKALHAYRKVAPRWLRRRAHERGGPLDHRAPGERRLLGRHPAARRLLA